MAPSDPLLPPPPVAQYLGVAEGTLKYWRRVGGGPPFVRLGRLVRYRQSAVDRWLEQQQRPRRRGRKVS